MTKGKFLYNMQNRRKNCPLLYTNRLLTFEEEGWVNIKRPVGLRHALKVRVCHLHRVVRPCPRPQVKLGVELEDEGEDVMDDFHHKSRIWGQQTPESVKTLAL